MLSLSVSPIDSISRNWLIPLALIFVFIGLPSPNLSGKSSDGIEIISSSASSLVISYTPNLRSVGNVFTESDIRTLRPEIAGSRIIDANPGAPATIAAISKITVPGRNGFHLADVRIGNVREIPGRMFPYPTLTLEGGLPAEKYKMNYNSYRNYNMPVWVELNYSGIARDRHVAELKIVAARYNPSANMIEVPERILITINFDDELIDYKSAPTKANFDPQFSLNHFQSKDWRINIIDSDDDIKSNNTDKMKSNSIQSENEEISSGNWVKIRIPAEGIYKIDRNMLSGLGFNLSSADAATLKIFGNGGKELSEFVPDAVNNEMNQQPVLVRTSGNGSFASVIFYAAPANGFEYIDGEFSHYINHYSVDNYYLLTWGGSAGLRADGLETPTGQPDFEPDTYYERLFYEEELYSPYKAGSGRQFFGRTYFSLTDEFIRMLHNLDKSGTIKFRFSVAHRSDYTGQFTVSQSNNTITTIPMKPSSSLYQEAYRNEVFVDYPAAQIPSDNRIGLRFNYTNSNGQASATAFFDYYEIHYPRSFLPIANQIGFYTDTSYRGIVQYRINEFSGPEIIGFEVTNPGQPKVLANTDNSIKSLFVFKTAVEDSPKKFFISSQFKTPSIKTTEFANLRSEQSGANVVVISPKAFIESAISFKNYRESSGELTVKVVNVGHIYNEFGSGVQDVTAIRDFLAYAYSNWETKPEYVVLWGDWHYDYKNVQTEKPNFIPPYESLDDTNMFDAIHTTTTDDYYARIVGNDMEIDLAIGRITVDSPRMGHWMVDKIKNYEKSSGTDSWRTTVTLVADDGPAGRDENDGARHTVQSETLAKYYIPGDMQIKKIYLVDYPTDYLPNGRRKPGATADMLTTITTTGTLMLNWLGHGNPQVWAHESVYDRELTTPLMTNMNKLFFVTAATCDFGRFDKTDVRSGAEEMLLSDVGGAIGVFSATRVVYSQQNADINNYFYNNVFTRNELTGQHPRLGEIMYTVKQKYNSQNDQKFFLLGDPTMRLLIPNLQVKINSINGITITDSTEIQLKGLSRVRISGSVINAANNEINTSFNGTAIVSMLDGDENIHIVDIDGYNFNFVKYGGALNRSAYEVTAGEFEASFVIPKDISYSESKGRLYTYAFTEDNRFAKGVSRNFRIEGLDTSALDDNTGPVISAFIDSRKFQNGGIVRLNPLLIVDLFDSTGINSTGIGIGHNIEVWIDDNPKPIDLTDKFFTSLQDNRYGTVQDILYELKPGNHKALIRAWDVSNNYTTAEISFRIVSSEESIHLSELLSIPNPFIDKTTISFRHNIAPPFNAELNIFSQNGQLLRTIKERINTPLYAEIPWDGLDNSGLPVPIGAYVYSILADTRFGNEVMIGSAGIKMK